MLQKIRLVYSKDYAVDIGNHVFPTSKYRLIKDRLLKDQSFGERLNIVIPGAARDEDVLLVHTEEYLRKLKDAALMSEDIARLELPYSKELVDSALICCGGTIMAADIALSDRVGIHIGGGFHHAFPDHGEGFCVLNDIAIAIKHHIKSNNIKKAMIIDCDLHHGNGTAFIFNGEPNVFTFSIHQENNYPFFKPRSSLDIGLPNEADDIEYMNAIADNVPRIIKDFKPDFLMYVAGADPYIEDQIGGLALTKEALARRDEFIFKEAANKNIPIAVVLAGGYAAREMDTVDIHCNTIKTALNIFYPASSKLRS